MVRRRERQHVRSPAAARAFGTTTSILTVTPRVNYRRKGEKEKARTVRRVPVSEPRFLGLGSEARSPCPVLVLRGAPFARKALTAYVEEAAHGTGTLAHRALNVPGPLHALPHLVPF